MFVFAIGSNIVRRNDETNRKKFRVLVKVREKQQYTVHGQSGREINGKRHESIRMGGNITLATEKGANSCVVVYSLPRELCTGFTRTCKCAITSGMAKFVCAWISIEHRSKRTES